MPDNTQAGSTTKVEAQENSGKKDPKLAAQSNPCSICKANGVPPPCNGHGKSGGGSGAGGNDGSDSDHSDSVKKSDKNDAKVSASHSSQITDNLTQGAMVAITADTALSQKLELNDQPFNPEVISDLLSKKLLIIDNARDSGILTIKVQGSASLLSNDQRKELKKFVEVILKELDEFKKEKKCETNCVAIAKDNENNFLSLRITLPKPAMYDAFIQRLASKNLLPQQNIAQQEKIEYQEGRNHFTPSSKAIEPTSRMTSQTKILKEAESSSIRPKSPLDGLKPKGWE